MPRAERRGAVWHHVRSWLDRRAVPEQLAIGLEALRRYKLRTALSVLGVVLGVAAVIAMMSVSSGARRETLRQVQLLGLDNIVVRNDLFAAQEGTRRSAGLTTGDARSVKLLVPLVDVVMPLVERVAPVQGPQGRGTQAVVGVTPDYASLLRLQLGRGRFLAAPDVDGRGRVCVLGGPLARTLFGFRDPLGRRVSIAREEFTVVGVLAERAGSARQAVSLAARDLNQAVMVPISVLLAQPPARDPLQRVDELWIRVADGERVLEIGRVVEHTLARLHRGVRDVRVIVPRELLNQRYRTQRTFSIVVGSVAVLSLLVGGIGIMNIMLASVLERTREIGVRRTVGATRRDVTLQFLTESLVMTLSGGAVGILTGTVVSWLISAYAGWHTHVSAVAVLLGFGVSVLVGLGFGIYPASQAARLDPIDALRYE